MLDPDRLFKLKIIGERKHDDLPCSECDKIAPILIIKCGDRDCTHDVCHGCAVRLRLTW